MLVKWARVDDSCGVLNGVFTTIGKTPLKIRGRGRNTTIKISTFCGCLIFGR